MPYALCPMPYALCPIVPHLFEKGYTLFYNIISNGAQTRCKQNRKFADTIAASSAVVGGMGAFSNTSDSF